TSARVVPDDSSRPFLVNTTLGISFIGAANGSVDVGQYDTMSWYVRLPMTCTPACHSVSTSQAVAPPSMVLNIQSISPPGPPTNPSSDTDILSMSLRIGTSTG